MTLHSIMIDIITIFYYLQLPLNNCVLVLGSLHHTSAGVSKVSIKNFIGDCQSAVTAPLWSQYNQSAKPSITSSFIVNVFVQQCKHKDICFKTVFKKRNIR